MGFRTAVNLVLALLVVVGLSVYADAAGTGQSATTKKKTTASSASSKMRKTSSRKGRKKERGQQAPTADRISEIQTALSKDGSYSGAPNGTWDDSTVAAMRNFQTTHGLNPSGKLDAPTLQKLGLGSQTAGVAAPIIPPNATSKLVSSNRQPAAEQ
jgi:peptidoglycan hydrolase-like protein with peptidoglycan-binding domain